MSQKKILVVEDNEDNRRILAQGRRHLTTARDRSFPPATPVICSSPH